MTILPAASHCRRAALLALAGIAGAGAAACRPAAREGETPPLPGPVAAAPAAATAAAPAAAPAAVARRDHVEADVRFMQHMIAHHAQAVTMTTLARTRAGGDVLRLLAERIAASQEHELAIMRRWLARRGAEVPAVPAMDGTTGAAAATGAHAHHGGAMPAPPSTAAGAMGGHASMPGMLTSAELARLAATSGGAFDRLFLEYMIRHHEGALVMVKDLLATPGAAREAELFGFASDVDADQRAEIRRMRALLAAPSSAPSPASPAPSRSPR